MSTPSLGDSVPPPSVATVTHPGLVLRYSSSFPPGHGSPIPSRLGQFSLDPHGLEAAYALQSVSEVDETQLSTEEIMRELSSSYVDSEVTFHKVIGSSKFLPTRPGVDPLEVTRPMVRDW